MQTSSPPASTPSDAPSIAAGAAKRQRDAADAPQAFVPATAGPGVVEVAPDLATPLDASAKCPKGSPGAAVQAADAAATAGQLSAGAGVPGGVDAVGSGDWGSVSGAAERSSSAPADASPVAMVVRLLFSTSSGSNRKCCEVASVLVCTSAGFAAFPGLPSRKLT